MYYTTIIKHLYKSLSNPLRLKVKITLFYRRRALESIKNLYSTNIIDEIWMLEMCVCMCVGKLKPSSRIMFLVK